MKEIIESGPIKIIKGVKEMQVCCICGKEITGNTTPERLTIVLNFGVVGNIARAGLVCAECVPKINQAVNKDSSGLGAGLLTALVKLLNKKEESLMEEKSTEEKAEREEKIPEAEEEGDIGEVKCDKCGNEFESRDIVKVIDQGRTINLCPECHKKFTEEKKKLDADKSAGIPPDDIK